jgi:hypothetical protein
MERGEGRIADFPKTSYFMIGENLEKPPLRHTAPRRTPASNRPRRQDPKGRHAHAATES